MPSVIDDTIQMTGDMVGPMGMLLGLMKLVHATGIVADGKNILLTVYLACITPACATVTSMAQLYHKDAAKSSVLYVLTTIFSIVTMPIMIGLYTIWL